MTLHSQLRTVLAQLELCSHVQAVNLNPSSRDSGEDIGGKRPPGGIDRKEDRAIVDQPSAGESKSRVLRSAEHFRRRVAKASSQHALEILLEKAKDALEAWKRQPAPSKSAEPKLGDPGWKRYVAESQESSSVLAARFGKSGQYIREVRRKYRDAA